MKKIIFIICLFRLCSMIFAQEIAVYDLMEPIIISVGSGEGEVGYKKSWGEGGGFAGPTFYTFSPTGNFYIFDHRNKRINVYNSSFKFIKTLNPNKEIVYDYFIWATIDENENLACILDMKGLYKLDYTGRIVFSIPIDTLPRSVKKNYNIFYTGENLLLYDDKAANNKIILIDNKGLKLTKEKTDTFINERGVAAENLQKIEDNDKKKFEYFMKENDLIIYNKKLLTTDFKKHRKYFNSLKEIENKSSLSKKIEDIKDDRIFERIASARFKGFDENGNSYWSCMDELDYKNTFIIILSNKGELTDFFTTKLIGEANITISPTGDIYLIKTNEEGCKIYKTIRQ